MRVLLCKTIAAVGMLVWFFPWACIVAGQLLSVTALRSRSSRENSLTSCVPHGPAAGEVASFRMLHPLLFVCMQVPGFRAPQSSQPGLSGLSVNHVSLLERYEIPRAAGYANACKKPENDIFCRICLAYGTRLGRILPSSIPRYL